MKERLSNFELLRIIAIFSVLMFHSNFHTIGIPTPDFVRMNIIESSISIFIQSITVICVDIFILISGWFGIHPRLRNFCGFIYQILFFMLGSYLLAILIGNANMSFSYLASCLFLDKNGWFIKAYLCLYILAPVCNEFVEHIKKKQFGYLLMSFYVFQSIYGWATDAAEFIHYGFSTISFIGLYLLGGYLRKYNEFLPSWTSKHYLLIFLGLSVTSVLMLEILAHIRLLDGVYHSLVGHMYAYTSPLVLFECVVLFLSFSKMCFKSNMVNFVASSSFSAILVHGNPCIITYTDRVLSYYSDNIYFVALVKVFIFNFLVFTFAIFIDQVRKYSWNLILKSLT